MRRDERGLTLIEVLVGLVLLSSFIGGIYTVAIGTMEARKKIQEVAAVGPLFAEPLKLFGKPTTRVENFCASGMDAFRNACFAVASAAFSWSTTKRRRP